MSRRTSKRARAARAGSRPAAPVTPPDFSYLRAIHEADEALAKSQIEIRPDNWQALALEFFASDPRDEVALAGYIAAHPGELGVDWARDILRLEQFLRANDDVAAITHYDRAMAHYPRCPLVELWVGILTGRPGGDWWRARGMLAYAIEHLPDYARPRSELGFLDFLLGDLPGALRRYDEAIARLTEDEAAIGAQTYHNRGLVRLALGEERAAAIADVEAALRLQPDYEKARQTLSSLQAGLRWVPW